MFIERFRAQLDHADQRYKDNTPQREARCAEVIKLRDGDQAAAVNVIDTPVRIARRLHELSRDPLASEAIIANAFQGGASVDRNLNVFERIINQNDLLSADFLNAGRRTSRTVGRVVLRSAGGSVLGFGTGFMVSPRLVMTNNHVLSTFSEAANSIIQFDFVETLSGGQLNPVEFAFDPSTFFATDQGMDFTLVAVESANHNGIQVAKRGWTPLIEESGKAIVGERVNVLQHPNGERQQLALRQNEIIDVVGDFLHYTSDTQRGSSGSPVLNDQWQLAALHHSGVPVRDAKGNILLKSGDAWDGTEETIDQIAWLANEGARISRVVSELRSREPSLTDEEHALLSQAFSPPELDDHEATSSNTEPEARYKDGRLVWTMPIEFSINVPSLGDKSRTEAETGGRQSRPREKRQSHLDEFSQANINRAKAAFAAHKNDEYYDAISDEAANIAYYADIDDAWVGDELFDALHDLVRTTHTNELNYTEARYDHLYPWIDLRPNRSLASIYSGDPVDFESVIASEALIEMRHALELQEFMLREGAFNEAAVNGFRFGLESQDPFNCEHIVPQSWFAHGEPMRSDLHHLITCEPGCNSSRSNNAYFEFDPDLPTFNSHCGQVKKSESKFEPVAGKGVVARATLYFLIRYPGQISAMPADRLPMLLKWHEDHAVSQYELHRNAEIESIQGNRNPLIDFPLWADSIPFENGLN